MILYLISGRSFSQNNAGRKLFEVINSFNAITETDVLFGGDIPVERRDQTSGSSAEYHSKWYRRNKLMLFFSESFSELKSAFHNLQTYKKIVDSSKSYDLIWERSSKFHYAGILYAKKHQITSVLEWKDHLIKDYPSLFNPLAKWIERWKNNNATFITVESEVLKKDLAKGGVDEKKIFVTYNAVNPLEFSKDEKACQEVRKELGIEDDAILVGYVGSYAFYHDSIRMLKAAKILRDKRVRNIKWLLIGDGKDKPDCERFAIENGLIDDGTVTMMPYQAKERIPHFLSAMDVTILPGSTDIICPIKVMEYMAAKSVVLVPDYPCNREVIDGSNGLLFEPGNENSIAEALLRLSNDSDLCERLGGAARKTVLEKFTWDKTYGAVLKSLLNSIEKKER